MACTDRVTGPERLQRALTVLVRRFGLAARAEVECCGTTVGQAAVLGLLADRGPCRSGEVAELLGVDASTTTRNLDRLAAKGLVERIPDPADGRARRIALTAAGREAAAEVERSERAFAGLILDQLPDGRTDEILEALESLLDAVRVATERCCPGVYDHLMHDDRPTAKECGACPENRSP